MCSVLNRIKQTGKEKSFFLSAIIVVFIIGSSAYGQRVFNGSLGQLRQSVTVYEEGNFKGRSRTFGVGEYSLTDFDDAVSSVKVPAGLVAMVYENAAGNGSGVWVDLLEDHYELSSLNLDNKISFIRVFSAANADGLIWARSKMVGGQFVAGHWERKRANGNNPSDSNAVVSPSPLAPIVSSKPTAIDVVDGQFTITTLGVQNSSDDFLWNKAETENMGIIGSDYRGQEEIGTAAFERASHNTFIPDNLNIWFPQKPPQKPNDRRNPFYKRTLIGKIADTATFDEDKDDNENPVVVSEAPHPANVNGTYEDHDVNIDVEPVPNYMYLIRDGHKPELSIIEALKLRKEHIGLRDNIIGEYDDPCRAPFKVVEAEIDMHPNAKNELIAMATERIGQQIGIYGAWIYDRGHCHHPEIHPAEQIWWSKNIGAARIYNLNVFCDATARFWWRSQMDDGTKIKPWGAPPIKGTFALSFEVEIKPGKYFGKKFEVQDGDSYNVAVNPGSNKIYNLVYQGNSLVSFNPKNEFFKVSFEKVGLKPGTTNIVRGFLVLETVVGSVKQIATRVDGINIPPGTDPNDAAKVPEDIEKKAFKKEEGQYMFTVRQTDVR